MWGTGRGRGEQLETLWAWLKGRVAFVTRYMTPAHRAGFIELVVQNRNHQLVSNSALQLYSMARHLLASLHFAREDVNNRLEGSCSRGMCSGLHIKGIMQFYI